MELTEVMTRLEALGTEQNRKVYRKHGAKEPLFGVSFGNLDKLKKEMKTKDALAEQLWNTGNTDARTLAVMIADPKTRTLEQLERWLSDIDYYCLTDMLVTHLASKSPLLPELLERWTASDREWVGRAGWQLMAHAAMKSKTLGEDYFLRQLERIEARIHSSPNRTRDAMNAALIAIGMRGEALEAAALAAAARIGKVEVDHGDTGCKTPDAAAYIAKAKSRKR
ncbi:DNA alkylation repair protein [Paenibacillus ehimensis]|uniref:DNA alkylation repair protein n=1 Tax=Paenibacillus ehimensis TaxID=79264 RepID=A0ABT8V5G7_9BACL|nr:DNA alkylation repair protein [Paenibacillus ehimensis]MDO3676659.1 DNA alkylation repair protein [Paenibacillus ehimensis]